MIRSEARERLEVECEVDIPDESIVEDLELVVEGFNRDKSSEETGRAEIDLDLELWLLNVGMLGNLTKYGSLRFEEHMPKCEVECVAHGSAGDY